MTTDPTTPPDSPLRVVATRTTHISCVYDGIPRAELARVTAFIDKSDFNFLFRDQCSKHGMQHKVTAGLLYAFIRDFRQVIAAHPDSDPYELMSQLLNNSHFTLP